MKKLAYFLLICLYLFAIFTVLATAEISGYEDFLRSMTQENGVFESISVLALLSISFYGGYALYAFRNTLSKKVYLFILFVSILTFLAAMEEISWGQSILKFASNDYFVKNNLQHETNLHNFIDSNFFSSLIYSSIYTLFVFIPLFYKAFFRGFILLRYFDLEMHHILIILFSSSFQLYFYDDFGVYTDMFTHVVALSLFAYVLWKQEHNLKLLAHYLLVLNATILFMIYHHVFGFLNMQYEIREMFVVVAVLFMFVTFIQEEFKKGF